MYSEYLAKIRGLLKSYLICKSRRETKFENNITNIAYYIGYYLNN